LIEHLTIRGFKSFENVSINLGALNFFLGANASGKSNLFDSLRVLQGIGYGLRIDEIFNGRPKSSNSEVWEAIRGGSAKAGLQLWVEARQKNVRQWVKLEIDGHTEAGYFRYAITLSPIKGVVMAESLRTSHGEVFTSTGVDNSKDSHTLSVKYATSGRGRRPHFSFDRGKPILTQILAHCSEPHSRGVRALLELLSNSQRLDPSPAILRDYSSLGEVRRLGERGENFAALVKNILAREDTAAAYRSWLERLTPKDLDEITTLSGALGEPLFALKHSGRVFPAPVLSDGTLRFSALAAAFFQTDMPQTLVLEEIENGIHPSRLRLLVELLRARSSAEGPQVMASTHSPVVVDWLTSDDMDHCFLCRRDEETGISTVTPLSSLPHFKELSRKQPAGELFVEGWMENSA
jgi:predicted ATPase